MEAAGQAGGATESGAGGVLAACPVRIDFIHAHFLEHGGRFPLDIKLLCDTRNFFALAELADRVSDAAVAFAAAGARGPRNRIKVLRVMLVLFGGAHHLMGRHNFYHRDDPLIHICLWIFIV